jgi:hypothetical protein
MDIATWSPFQSDQVREICEHMTPAEKRRAAHHGAVYGVWVSVTVAMPVSIIALRAESGSAWLIGGGLVLLHLAVLPLWQRRVREFLCSTSWAVQQRIRSRDLKLFGWRI